MYVPVDPYNYILAINNEDMMFSTAEFDGKVYQIRVKYNKIEYRFIESRFVPTNKWGKWTYFGQNSNGYVSLFVLADKSAIIASADSTDGKIITCISKGNDQWTPWQANE